MPCIGLTKSSAAIHGNRIKKVITRPTKAEISTQSCVQGEGEAS